MIPDRPFSSADGTIYITNGTAGGNPTGPEGKICLIWLSLPIKPCTTFAIMDVSYDSITYRVFDQDNSLIDRFIVKK